MYVLAPCGFCSTKRRRWQSVANVHWHLAVLPPPVQPDTDARLAGGAMHSFAPLQLIHHMKHVLILEAALDSMLCLSFWLKCSSHKHAACPRDDNCCLQGCVRLRTTRAIVAGLGNGGIRHTSERLRMYTRRLALRRAQQATAAGCVCLQLVSCWVVA